ncbi:hypothetical protein N7520_009340 [Penicillium odoratum]|uniref:uncharacterized protein n=1 Tax=Penicillium odoratum TaxID=1167516 RepID=UPI002546E920|nr:uncharacterized protein N7520_009340 [Penicillium odoratum]KAJ5752423.1 hypothetical protein N7520_009340 [Penicillium odoratum]
MAEDMMTHQGQSTPWVGGMMKPMQENENHMPQSTVSTENCTCSATTGPCIGHMEKMRLELLGELVSPLQLHNEHQQQQNQNNNAFEANMARLQTRPLTPSRNYSSYSSR